MELAEIQRQALALSEQDRASLAATILQTLPPALEISDEEVDRRDAELDSGEVSSISHEELVRRVGHERGR